MRRFLRSLMLISALLPFALGAVMGQQRPQPVEPQTQSEQENTDAKLRRAASFYAIIQILLDDGDFDRVPNEFQKILDLDLAGENERQLGQAAWQIVHRLSEQHRYAQAHTLVEMTLQRVQQPETRFSLLMLQAKVFQAQRLLPQAIETVRRAQEVLNQEQVKPQ